MPLSPRVPNSTPLQETDSGGYESESLQQLCPGRSSRVAIANQGPPPPVPEPPTGVLVDFLNSTQILHLLTNSQDIDGGRKCEEVAAKEDTAALKGVFGEGLQ